MYNLIVGAVDGNLPADRLLEVVEDGLDDFIRPQGELKFDRLLSLPSLLTPEVGSSNSKHVVQIGKVVSLTRVGRQYRFHFVADPTLPPIPAAHIMDSTQALHIGAWDLSRTRWSVKNCDLYQALISERLLGTPSPTVFKLPPVRPNPGQISVMMPFDTRFYPVWDALRVAAKRIGWTCQRADDIWEDTVVINDIVSLIARSEVVICDATGRNANVFYEAGIAHTLGRQVILITQARADVPFDLSHHRFIEYLNNTEGLSKLGSDLQRRLTSLESQ